MQKFHTWVILKRKTLNIKWRMYKYESSGYFYIFRFIFNVLNSPLFSIHNFLLTNLHSGHKGILDMVHHHFSTT